MMKLLTANQAAEYLNISRVTFWMMRKNCPISTVKVGSKSVRYTTDILDKWIAEYDPDASYRNA